MSEAVQFKVRARLLEQMGEQLIKSESIALMELIKNAYDADASHCKIEMRDITTPDSASIVITDDGTGMSYDILKNVWLDIGTSNKADKKKSVSERTPKYNRIPMGEKGIGRFGVHRLGREIEILTRMSGNIECRIFINWDNIGQSKYIENFPITLKEYPPEIFKNCTGTKIIIRRLKNKWDRGTVRECARAITSLNSPFDEKSSFRAELVIPDSDWLAGLLEYDDIKDYKLFSFEAKMKDKFITDFKYSFIPYPNMKGIEVRNLDINTLLKGSLNRLVKKENKKLTDIDLSTAKIGTVIFKGIIFDLDSQTLNTSMLTDKKGLKDYLSINGGVRVFRDNLRIWDYGEPENDWLEMETRRINQPTLKISKRLIIGAVYLDSGKSQDLIEKANREGFMDNHAYQLLKDACRSVLEKVELYRREDKEKLRILYGSTTKKIPVISSLAEAKAVVDEHIQDKAVVNEIDRCLDRIEDDYNEITGNLMKSAGAGLNLIVVIHQMQKILKEITAGLKSNISNEQIRQQIDDLANLVEGYSIIVKKSDIKVRNLKGILKQALFNLEFRFHVHKINFEAACEKRMDHLDAVCTESHVVNAVMNLVDNSIWWMDFARSSEKSVYIDISPEYKGYTTIVVADTGPGFTVATELLGEPFVTAKPDGEGMGIGLHLTKLIMESLGGKILYPDYGDFYVPEKYKNGAIVALAFKEKKE